MIGGSLAVLAVAAALVLNALRDSIVFFSTPSMAAEKQIPAGKRFRLGGLVENGSLKRGEGMTITFSVTDTLDKVPVTYTGILPDLFREGQGVVAEGSSRREARFSLPIPCLPSMTRLICPRTWRTG